MLHDLISAIYEAGGWRDLGMRIDPDEVRLSVAHMAKTADRYEQLTFGTDKN